MPVSDYKWKSDSIQLSCNCSKLNERANEGIVEREKAPRQGIVLLFYNYTRIKRPSLVVEKLEKFIQENNLELSGKFRFSSEGMNVTFAGSLLDVKKCLLYFVAPHHVPGLLERKDTQDPEQDPGFECLIPGLEKLLGPDSTTSDLIDTLMNWDFKDTSTPSTHFFYSFFKPSDGCIHVFDGLSIKSLPNGLFPGIDHKTLDIPCTSLEIINEMMTQYSKKIHSKVVHLNPKEFHEMLVESRNDPDTLVFDVRYIYITRGTLKLTV